MIRRIEGITLGSQSAKKLADFYKKVVGLKLTFEAVMGEGKDETEFYEFDMKGCSLYIADDRRVKGKSKNPQRFILNLEVDNIDKEFKKIKKAGQRPARDI